MSHKLLSYLGIALLIISTSQCLSKCTPASPYNTVDVDLKWEEGASSIALNGLGIERAFGLTCHIPSENATYFLNAVDGNVWEFTPDGENDLTCKSIASVESFNLNSSFVFASGSKEKQSLFFGSISGTTIDIYKLEDGTWNQVINAQDLSAFFPDATVNINKFIAACTVEVQDQKKGCLIISLVPNITPTKVQLGCLLFSETDSFKVIDIDSIYNARTNPSAYLIGMVEVEKGKIFLGKGYGTAGDDRYDLLLLKEDDTLTVLSSDNPNPFTVKEVAHASNTTRPTWSIFPLLLEGEFPIYKPTFTILHDKKRTIYRLDSKYMFQHMSLLSDPENKILDKPNLIIPFSNALYLITNITTDDQNQTEETVAYKAKLARANNKPESKP
jgi:hypothetical protein